LELARGGNKEELEALIRESKNPTPLEKLVREYFFLCFDTFYPPIQREFRVKPGEVRAVYADEEVLRVVNILGKKKGFRTKAGDPTVALLLEEENFKDLFYLLRRKFPDLLRIGKTVQEGLDRDLEHPESFGHFNKTFKPITYKEGI